MPVEIERKFLVAKGGPSVSFVTIRPSGSVRMRSCASGSAQPLIPMQTCRMPRIQGERTKAT
jgi:hypothetical protein